MEPLMVLMIASFWCYLFETHWNILMVKSLAMLKSSNRDLLMVKLLALYLKIYM